MNHNDNHNHNSIDLFPHTIIQPNTMDMQIERNAVRFYSTKCFSLPLPITSRYFKHYFLLYYRGDYILNQINDNQGFLRYKNTKYQIVYKLPLTRGKILARLQDQFALSFREPFSEFGIDPIVIISFSNGA